VHLGPCKSISHIHAKIEFDRTFMYYKLVNLSKNGLSVKQGDKFVKYTKLYDTIPLSNPAVINIQVLTLS
jgi:hypothetical protein